MRKKDITLVPSISDCLEKLGEKLNKIKFIYKTNEWEVDIWLYREHHYYRGVTIHLALLNALPEVSRMERLGKLRSKINELRYKLKEGDTAYLFFDAFLITLDFLPGKPRFQIENEEGELVQELNWDKKDKKFT